MGVASFLERVLLVMDAPKYRVPQFAQLTMTCCIECYGVLVLRVCRRKVCVETLGTASSNTDFECHPCTCVLGVVLCLGFRVGCRGG